MKEGTTVFFLALVFVVQAAKNKTDKWTEDSLDNAEEVGEHFEGDIILPLPGLDRSGLLDKKYRWPGGKVPYEIDPSFTEHEMAKLKKAMLVYDRKTKSCIRFVERSSEKDFIFFRSGSRGCSSMVGKRGGKQVVQLAPACFFKFGTILHEMLHALGFFHEQSRTDRDKYVTIVWKNINNAHKGNFRKYSGRVIGPFGVPYDYNSVMHYSEYAFSNSYGRTIIPVDPNARIGQRRKLSRGDIRKLKNMYKCKH